LIHCLFGAEVAAKISSASRQSGTLLNFSMGYLGKMGPDSPEEKYDLI
jgi:hypothetical protein